MREFATGSRWGWPVVQAMLGRTPRGSCHCLATIAASDLSRLEIRLLLLRLPPQHRTPPGGNQAAGAGLTDPKVIALGKSVFEGRPAGGMCFTCHGQDANGAQLAGAEPHGRAMAPRRRSYDFIVNTVTAGVSTPEQCRDRRRRWEARRLRPSKRRRSRRTFIRSAGAARNRQGYVQLSVVASGTRWQWCLWAEASAGVDARCDGEHVGSDGLMWFVARP